MSYLDRAAIARGIKAKIQGSKLLKRGKLHGLAQAIREPSATGLTGETATSKEMSPMGVHAGKSAA